MKNHIGIFIKVCGYAVGYFIATSLAYFTVVVILQLLGIPEPSEVTGEFITDLAALPLVIVLFKLNTPENRKQLFEVKLSLKKILLLIPISLFARILLLIAIVLLLTLVVVISGKDLSSLIDQGLDYQWQAFEKTTGIVQYLGFVSFVFLGPLNEELFNRGVVFNYLQKHYSVRASIIYSSVVFMLLHIHPGLYLSSFILGVVLAVVYARWKNIWYSVFLHMLINLHPFILTYFFGPR
jgi:hypothetical protein